MTVEFFNLPYFIFLFSGLGITVALHFLLRNKSEKTKKIVVFSLLLLNFALHFFKLFFPPYNESLERGLRDVFAVNICAVSVIVFPFIFLSKSKDAKDFMFYLGVLSGFLALVIPTEALGEQVWQFDLFRFYIAHAIIMIAPLLMVSLKVHKLNYRKIWKMPLYMIVYFMFIMVNQVIQSELGIVSIRNGNFLDINFRNPSFFWKKPDNELAILFDIFTPNAFKYVPVGEFAGEAKYWPLIWITPAIAFYFIVFPLLLSAPWEGKKMWADLKWLASKVAAFFVYIYNKVKAFILWIASKFKGNKETTE